MAVTSGPGLAPCLDVGLKTAMQLSEEHSIDFVQVNHLEAHLLVSRLPEVSDKALELLLIELTPPRAVVDGDQSPRIPVHCAADLRWPLLSRAR